MERTVCRNQRQRGKRSRRLCLEALESRTVPSTTWPGLNAPQSELEPNGSAIFSQNLGDLSSTGQLSVVGTTMASPGGAGQADWYRFTLDHASTVSLRTLDKGYSPFVSALSLYDDDVGDYADLYNPTGYRLVGQADGSLQGGDAQLTQMLAPGTYFFAVSGSGDRYFSPLMTGSGYSGSTGPYGLLLTAVGLGLDPGAGPVVVNASPGQGNALAASPFELRVDFSSALDPASLAAGQSVQLLYSKTPLTGPGQGNPIGIYGLNLGPGGMELQITPAAPLVPGYYEIFLAGNTGTNAGVVTGTGHTPLGANATNPQGKDATINFQITGNEGILGASAGADDTLATAQDLGSIAGSGLVQVMGAIGNDSTDPIPFDPSDVNLYHFVISGSGRFSFQTEAFAGRIGSPLDTEVSLYQLNSDGSLSLVGWNDNSGNTTPSDDGSQVPLLNDSSFFAGLTAGNYYLAVYSSDFNFQNPPSLNLRTTHSYQGGHSTGPYVLNLLLQSDNTAPQVVSVTTTCAGADGNSYSSTLANGTVLTAAPLDFRVKFSEEVNLTEYAENSYNQTNSNILNAIFISGPGGTIYHPRFYSYTGDSSNSDFLMYDALPNGTYELHLSGPLGLTDLAGNPLTGNAPGGDYVITFSVNGDPRGTPSDPTYWLDINQPGQLENIGVVFPDELQSGVTVQRNSTAGQDGTDWFQFRVLQQRYYTIRVSGQNLPADLSLTLTDASGALQRWSLASTNNSQTLISYLSPGVYKLDVSTASGSLNGGMYLVTFSILFAQEPPPPLTLGSAPAIRVRHIVDASVTPATSTPIVTPVAFVPGPSGLIGPINVAGGDPSIPSGLLVSLATGPLTGSGALALVGAAADSGVGQLVISQTREVIVSEALVRLPLLVNPAGSGTPENLGAGGGLSSLVTTLLGRMEGISWKRIVELLHVPPTAPEQGQAPLRPASEAGQEEQSDDKSDKESALARPAPATGLELSDALKASALMAMTVLMHYPRDQRPRQQRGHLGLRPPPRLG